MHSSRPASPAISRSSLKWKPCRRPTGWPSTSTSRAPSAEELFANGPHAGTQAFEIGNPDFKLERSWGLEAVLRGKGTGYTLEASAFYNWFDNFVFDNQTGRLDHALLSQALAKRLVGAAEWHTNADEPDSRGYQTHPEDRSPRRSSDHDPLVVGFRLRKP